MSHPQCSWQCDNQICDAECKIVYTTPVCTCSTNQTIVDCVVQCDPDQFEINVPPSCPNCYTDCTNVTNCNLDDIQCEQITAQWACRKPNCPYPICQLQCEQPNCPYTGQDDVWKTKSNLNFSTILGIFILVFILYKWIH